MSYFFMTLRLSTVIKTPHLVVLQSLHFTHLPITPNMASHHRLLLFSNSTMAGTRYMEWASPLITSFLGPSVKEILFVPFAGVTITWDEYSKKVQEALPSYTVRPIHQTGDGGRAAMVEAVKKTEAIMIGGGNTFHLLYKLYEFQLLDAIRDRVLGASKTPYIGWSAGSNVAGPDIGTTNDMPIIWPESDRALNLVPYNLNPHFNEWKPPNYQGEVRGDRLNECVLLKKRPIVALAEGVAIKVEEGKHQLLAPPLSSDPNAEERTVKVWTHENGQTQITQLSLQDELTEKISSIAK